MKYRSIQEAKVRTQGVEVLRLRSGDDAEIQRDGLDPKRVMILRI
jgi:hypothetical protein